MDNFAVTIAAGCANGGVPRGRALLISAVFALAHIVMFSAGWLGGHELGRLIDRWDHWVAFAVLVFIGGKMLWGSAEETQKPDGHWLWQGRTIAGLAVATSLDALGVGIALSLEEAPFGLTLGLMTACVAVTSYAGFGLGRLLGGQFGKRMEIVGGLVLIGIGTKVLLSGLGIW